MSTLTTYDDLLARIRTLVTTAEDRIPVVGISGHGGAGKSTLAERLAADLGLEEDQVVATDAFYATTCGPDAGMWEQHDWAAIEMRVADHAMPPVLLVEGIRLISDRTREWFDLAVWIDLDPDTAGERAKARNVLQGDDRAELDLWDTKWIPEGHDYERSERPRERADLVLIAER